MKKYLYILFSLILCLASCSETNNVHDPYEDWQSRNAKWFEDTALVASQAIAQAKAQYGNNWEEHCEWRMFKSLLRTSTSTGPVTDSICVRILKHGEDLDSKGSPASNDSAYICYRGWTMPITNYIGNGTSEMGIVQDVFESTYVGDHDAETAAPQLMSVSNLIEGFSTAMQYMVEGDEWMVFIPQQLGYGGTDRGTIKAYSTLQFHIHLVRWYESGTGIPNKWE